MSDKEPAVTFLLRTDRDFKSLYEYMTDIEPDKEHPMRVRIDQKEEHRRLKQNRLAFKWYDELSMQTGHGKEYERKRCKLSYGVPILMTDEDFAADWNATLGALTYEQQLVGMQYFDVTSRMTVRQFAEYLTTIDNESINMGLHLTHPDDLYWDALMKQNYAQ